VHRISPPLPDRLPGGAGGGAPYVGVILWRCSHHSIAYHYANKLPVVLFADLHDSHCQQHAMTLES
jgi:hypothetical protein